jgi:hypothetical protein
LGSFGVALGSHWGAYRLAINRLWSGFDVALRWLWGGPPAVKWSRFSGFMGAAPFLLFALCFLFPRLPDFSPFRCSQPSRRGGFAVQLRFSGRRMPCQTPAGRLKSSRAFSRGQRSPPRPALTSDLRQAVTRRVSYTGPPPLGQRASFIRTTNCRQGNGGRKRRILRFFFL